MIRAQTRLIRGTNASGKQTSRRVPFLPGVFLQCAGEWDYCVRQDGQLVSQLSSKGWTPVHASSRPDIFEPVPVWAITKIELQQRARA
jgi:hypothetical protein